MRSKLLAGRFSAWAEDRSIAEIATRSLNAQQAIAGWHGDTPNLSPDQESSRLAELREWHKQWEAGVKLLFEDVPAEGYPSSILDAGHVSLNELDPLLRSAASRLGIRGAESRKRLVERVRRLRPIREVVDPHGKERFGKANRLELAVLDRVEALLAVWELFRVPRATALLSAGAQALGEVFRDSSWVRHLLETTREGEAYTRRALVVALGLLGSPPVFESAVPDRSDADDAAVWALSVLLGNWKIALGVLDTEISSARGEAERVLDTAVMRVEGWSGLLPGRINEPPPRALSLPPVVPER
jgi:hypothetical protein